MKVVSASHTSGHLEFDNAGSEEQGVRRQKAIKVEQYGEVVYFEMLAGQISLHSDLLVLGPIRIPQNAADAA